MPTLIRYAALWMCLLTVASTVVLRAQSEPFVRLEELALPPGADYQETPFFRETREGQLVLTTAGASHFARLALNCLHREYPNKLNQILRDSSMLRSPRTLHPAFYGCFDWHSAVHGHWMLVRLLRTFPDLPEAQEIRFKLDAGLSKSNIRGEVAYFATETRSWERTYGWAWLLKLSEELHEWDDADARRWEAALEPLTEVIVQRYVDFLPVQKYPVRAGTHANTAFGLAFAWDYAEATERDSFRILIEERARDYYLFDKNCPADYEPSGEDFLSPCLVEADLMRRVLRRQQYAFWFTEFLPRDKLKSLLRPAIVTDRSDMRIVHLDGLNLSRAWCMYGATEKLRRRGRRRRVNRAAELQLRSAIPNIATEHYEGTHWLASFAVYALSVNLEYLNRRVVEP